MSLRQLLYDSLTAASVIIGKVPLCGPRVVQLNVSDECNLNCIMCNRSLMNVHGYMTAPAVFAVVGELYQLGLRELYFHGYGEPFLNPHLLDFFSGIKHRFPKLKQFVVTNGTLLTDKAVRCIHRAGVRVRISLHAGERETWNRIHPRDKADFFDRIQNGISSLCSRSGRVEVLFVIHRSNADRIESMFDFCRRTGVKHMLLRPMRLYMDPDGKCMNDMLLLSADEHSRAVELIQRMKNVYKGIVTVDSTPFDESTYMRHLRRPSSRKFYERNCCLLGWVFSLILTDGTVLGCLEESFDLPLGNIHRQSFRSIWWGEPYRQFRRQGLSMQTAIEDENCRTWCQHLRTNRRWNRIRQRQFGTMIKEMNDRSH